MTILTTNYQEDFLFISFEDLNELQESLTSLKEANITPEVDDNTVTLWASDVQNNYTDILDDTYGEGEWGEYEWSDFFINELGQYADISWSEEDLK